VHAILDHDADLKREPHHVKFMCEVDGDRRLDLHLLNGTILTWIVKGNIYTVSGI
jgi:hypothetical protein